MKLKIFTWVIVVINVYLVLGMLGTFSGAGPMDCSERLAANVQWCRDFNADYLASQQTNSFASLFFINLLLLPIWFLIKKNQKSQQGRQKESDAPKN